MTLLRSATLICLLNGCAIAAMAQTMPAPEPLGSAEMPSVTITAGKGTQRWSYRSLLVGMDKYDAMRALAPASTLRFVVPESQRAAAPDAGVWIVGGAASIGVPLAADGSFALPRERAARRDKASVTYAVRDEIAAGVKEASFATYPMPEVRTPGVPAGSRRLGDLRLECNVKLAITKDILPFFVLAAMNTMFAGVNWCDDPKAESGLTRYLASAPLDGAMLVSGERRMALKVTAGSRTYLAPVHDKTWPDDALIEFAFSAQGAAAGGAAPDKAGIE